jgi:hypothetical protein
MILADRLHNQRLSASEFKKPADVVRWLGAVQAQDFNGAKWALALRMRQTTNAAIEDAYNAGEILRTHLMRPTWHFVAPDDIRWLLELTAPRVNIKSGPNYRKLELDHSVFNLSNKVLVKALKGGKHQTRSALRKVLNDAGVAVDDSVRLAHIFLRAELDGVVCSGPLRGKQFTYALLDERVPATKALTREEALAKLTRRYFTSHGPATLQDFMWWSGLTVADARQGTALIDRHLRKAVVDEKDFLSPRSVKSVPGPTYSAHLLPAYDEYTVAYKDRHAIFNVNDTKSPLTVQGLLDPIVIVDGRMVGTWKRTNDKKSMTITLDTVRALTRLENEAIAKAVDRYAAFIGTPARVVF